MESSGLCSASTAPRPKIVDQNLENAPAGENEMTLLGREESLGGRFRIAVALVAGSDRARYGLSQVRSYGAVVAGARSVAVTGKWSEG